MIRQLNKLLLLFALTGISFFATGCSLLDDRDDISLEQVQEGIAMTFAPGSRLREGAIFSSGRDAVLSAIVEFDRGSVDEIIASSRFTEHLHRRGPLPLLDLPEFDVGAIEAKNVLWVDERSDGAPLNVARTVVFDLDSRDAVMYVQAVGPRVEKSR